MVKTIGVPDRVYSKADEIAEEYGYSYKEAVRHVFREAGYDV